MNKHRKNDAFDDTLYRAFHDYSAEEKEDIPSDEELKRLFPLPEDYLQRIDDMIAEVNRREKRNAALAHLKRAAVIVLVTATAAFSALLCNSGVRAAVRNTLLDWFGDHVRISSVSHETDSTSGSSRPDGRSDISISEYSIGYLPEGFAKALPDYETEDQRQMIYRSEAGEYLVIDIYDKESTEIFVSIDDQKYSEIKLGQNPAYIFYDDNAGAGMIFCEYAGQLLCVDGHASEEDLIAVAGGLIDSVGD